MAGGTQSYIIVSIVGSRALRCAVRKHSWAKEWSTAVCGGAGTVTRPLETPLARSRVAPCSTQFVLWSIVDSMGVFVCECRSTCCCAARDDRLWPPRDEIARPFYLTRGQIPRKIYKKFINGALYLPSPRPDCSKLRVSVSRAESRRCTSRWSRSPPRFRLRGGCLKIGPYI